MRPTRRRYLHRDAPQEKNIHVLSRGRAHFCASTASIRRGRTGAGGRAANEQLGVHRRGRGARAESVICVGSENRDAGRPYRRDAAGSSDFCRGAPVGHWLPAWEAMAPGVHVPPRSIGIGGTGTGGRTSRALAAGRSTLMRQRSRARAAPATGWLALATWRTRTARLESAGA
jgi:hypothetical protein